MRGYTLHRDIECVRRCHDRSRMPPDRAGGELRPVVKAQDGIRLVGIERTGFQHRTRTAQRFLARLEDEHHAPRQLGARIREHRGNAERDRRVRVVPASVHLAGNLRCERQPGRFVHGQCVHVGANRDGRSRLRALEHRNDPRSAHAGPAGDAQPAQEFLHALRGLVLLERKLRMLVDPAPQRDQVAHPAIRGWVHALQQVLRRCHADSFLLAGCENVEYRVRAGNLPVAAIRRRCVSGQHLEAALAQRRAGPRLLVNAGPAAGRRKY